MPSLETDVWQVWQDKGLVAYAISSSTIGPENPQDLAEYVEGMKLTMTVLADYDVTVYYDYRINDPDAYAPYPREYVVDRDGTIVYMDSNIDVVALNALLEELLGD